MVTRILVPLDGSATSQRGLREAIDLARPLKARLVLLHVIDDYPIVMEMASAMNVAEWHRRRLAQGEGLLADARARAGEAGVPCDTVLREDTAAPTGDAILSEVRQQGCDLVVMGTHGRRGLNRLAMGSDAERVLRAAPVPVLLVRQPEAAD